jgi:hypothetical protein
MLEAALWAAQSNPGWGVPQLCASEHDWVANELALTPPWLWRLSARQLREKPGWGRTIQNM